MSANNNQLELMFSDDTYQLTGVAISKDGRLFTCYLHWPCPHKWGVVATQNKLKRREQWAETQDG